MPLLFIASTTVISCLNLLDIGTELERKTLQGDAISSPDHSRLALEIESRLVYGGCKVLQYARRIRQGAA